MLILSLLKALVDLSVIPTKAGKKKKKKQNTKTLTDLNYFFMSSRPTLTKE